MSADKRIVEKLDNLVYDLERLGTRLDIPSHDMTLGEYEDKRREIVESCARSIEEMLGAGTCRTVAMDCFGNPPYNQSGLNGNSTACGCSECGAPWSTTGLFRGNQLKHNFRACPLCGRRVVSE